MATARKNWQVIQWSKPGGRSQTTSLWTSLIQSVGPPGTGVLAGTDLVAGVVPTDATAGFPTINAFSGDPGFVHRIDISGGTAGASPGVYKWSLYDVLWKAGAYAFNAAQVLAGQPSYSSRIPGGTDYGGTEIWIEIVTAFTGIPTLQITYTSDSGAAGQVTTYTPLVAPATTNTMFQVPLLAGDDGAQKIENVTCTIATVGTFNVLVMRPIAKNLVTMSDLSRSFDEAQTGMPRIWDDSAILPICWSSSTLNTTNPDFAIYVARGTPGVGAANDFNIDVQLPPTRSDIAPVIVIVPGPAAPTYSIPTTITPDAYAPTTRTELGGLLDMAIDPNVLDYIDTADGDWLETADSRTMVMMMIELRLGQSFATPEDGTTIRDQLENAEGRPVTADNVVDEVLRALQLLVNDGRIADLAVSPNVDETGRFALDLVWRDLATGSQIDLLYTPFQG